MTTETCPKCKGDGIIGAGDRPWEKVGATSTCDLCNGTGVVDNGEIVATDAEKPVSDEEIKAPEGEEKKEEKQIDANAGVGSGPVTKDYKILAEEGLATPATGFLPKDSIVKLDPADENTATLLNSGTIEEVVENAVA